MVPSDSGHVGRVILKHVIWVKQQRQTRSVLNSHVLQEPGVPHCAHPASGHPASVGAWQTAGVKGGGGWHPMSQRPHRTAGDSTAMRARAQRSWSPTSRSPQAHRPLSGLLLRPGTWTPRRAALPKGGQARGCRGAGTCIPAGGRAGAAGAQRLCPVSQRWAARWRAGPRKWTTATRDTGDSTGTAAWEGQAP